MIDPLALLTLAAIVLVGMALALTQFCMVRAVRGVREGVVSPARCVLAISLAIAFSLQLLAILQGGESRPSYTPAAPVVLGGLLFGVAARANGGCCIGTLNELSRGQWRRLYTVAGWILGFALLQPPPLASHGQRPWEVGLVIPELQGGWAWGLMLACGLLMGLLHHTAWPWHPSSLARQLGQAVTGADLPLSSSCALLLPLGMLLVHRQRDPVQSQQPVISDLPLLLWGTLMGLGTAWGMGANDGYLFRHLPVGSLHAAVGLAAMSAGILLPLDRLPLHRLKRTLCG